MSLLQEESKLQEIVRLVGADALSTRERLVLLVSKSIREDFLYQDSFSVEDAYTIPMKQYQMLKTITHIYKEGLKLLDKEEFDFSKVEDLPVIQKVAKIKEIKADDIPAFESLRSEVERSMGAL